MFQGLSLLAQSTDVGLCIYHINWFIPQALCHYCTSATCMQVTIVGQRFCNWVGIYFFYLGSMLIWDSPLCAMNMFYYHLLIKNLLWPMAGQNIARLEIQVDIEEERRRSQRDTMELSKKKDARALLVSHSLMVIHNE